MKFTIFLLLSVFTLGGESKSTGCFQSCLNRIARRCKDNLACLTKVKKKCSAKCQDASTPSMCRYPCKPQVCKGAQVCVRDGSCKLLCKDNPVSMTEIPAKVPKPSQTDLSKDGSVIGIRYFQGHLYSFNQLPEYQYLTWDDAKGRCEKEFSGTLSSIVTFAEYDFLRTAIVEFNLGSPGDFGVMFGAYKVNGTSYNSGTGYHADWAWVDGNKKYWPIQWAAGQPDNAGGDENVIELWPVGFNDFQDGDYWESAWVCKKPYDIEK